MAVNKVEYGGDTLIDLTGDSVTPQTLAEGETAHNAAGEEITGTLKVQDEIVTTTGTGAAYEATVRGITELKTGVGFVMIPHTVSTTANATLNVNGFGAKRIYRKSINPGIRYGGYYNNWLGAGRPYKVVYDGFYWIVLDLPKTEAGDIDGRIAVSNGGVPTTSSANAGKVLTTNASGTPEWQEPTGGEIDPSTLATLDKITSFDLALSVSSVQTPNEYGIRYCAQSEIELNDGEEYLPIRHGTTLHMPMVAGDNVTFTVDEENKVVKINAPQSMLGEWEFNETIDFGEIDFFFDFEAYSPSVGTVILYGDIYNGGDSSNPVLVYEGNEYDPVYSYGKWVDMRCKIINILTEPTEEAAAWIKTNAKRKQPVGVDEVKVIDTWSGDMESVNIEEDGIDWSNQFAFFNDNGDVVSSGAVSFKIPIVAGENVDFSYDENNNAIAINATSSGVDPSTLATLDKIDYFGLSTNVNGVYLNEYGISVSTNFYVEDEDGITIGSGEFGSIMPIIAGDNVTFVKDEGNKFVKINSTGGGSLQMPQIRFANFQDTQGTMRLYEVNPFTFTVEIVGGGELKVGDLLQICVRRKYWYRNHDTDEIRHKWKLRKVVQREITAEDIGKRFLSINVTLADVESRGNWMFHNDRKTTNVDTHSYMYFRIKRVTKWSETTGEECDAIFSNVEKVAKTYEYSAKKLTIK